MFHANGNDQPLQALTAHLPMTYKLCNGGFNYQSSRNPRRVLTKPSKGVKNDGYDNEDSDYILYVNDILGSEESGHKNRYLILDVLGQGTFGQVVKCQNLKTQEVVAVKVIKNRTAYFNQSMMEVSVLDLVSILLHGSTGGANTTQLNKQMDKNDDHHLLRLKDTFIHRQHLCLVFELLSVNLYELIKQNQFRGLSTTLVRVFAQQLINGLALLGKAKLIHCDLKPENILLKKYVALLTFVRAY
jgi:dual specificity protein kinase YAK1